MNILTEPIFQSGDAGETSGRSLVDLIDRLLVERHASLNLTHLPIEQRGYFYRLLLRSAGKAFQTRGWDPDAWTSRNEGRRKEALVECLVELTGGSSAWQLYEADPASSAFLQVPVSGGTDPQSAGYTSYSCSLLTVIVGTKNHEEKVDSRRELYPDQLVYALTAYQLGSIFGGRGRYGSPLMGSQSGKGSGLPFMGVRIDRADGATFQHDLRTVLNRWDSTASKLGLAGDRWALWIDPWEGTTSVPARDLDPAFIPVARLVRMSQPRNGKFSAVWFKSTTARRVEDHSGGGVLGDTLTPLIPHPKTDGFKIRGTMDSGYTYPEVVKLLGVGGGVPSASVEAAVQDGDADDAILQVRFEGIAFEQGKTLGFHAREIPLSRSRARSLLEDPEPFEVAHDFMLSKAKAASKAVRGAIRTLVYGDASPSTGDEGVSELGREILERAIDLIYVDRWMTNAVRQARGDTEYQTEWTNWLSEQAQRAFEHVVLELPRVESARYQREANAELWLGRRLSQMRNT